MNVARKLAVVVGVAWSTVLGAQASDPAALRSKVKAYSVTHDAEIVRELSNFLAIPNLASDAANIRRNADYLMRLMAARGITTRLLESQAGGPP
ncbi:MAG TPA: hypothetical protein VIP11_05300, partial [Gemmatimonadaceae bacterium]